MGLQVSEIHQQRCALLETGDKYMEYGYTLIIQGMFLFELSFQGIYFELNVFLQPPLALVFHVLSIF